MLPSRWKNPPRLAIAIRASCRLRPNSMVDERPPSQHRFQLAVVPGVLIRAIVSSYRPLLALVGFAAMLSLLAQPAMAGMEEASRRCRPMIVPTAEKDLQVLVKERDPRAQFLAGLYVYGNPEFEDLRSQQGGAAAARCRRARLCAGDDPACRRLRRRQGRAEERVRCLQVARHRRTLECAEAPQSLLDQVCRELKPDEIEKAKAAALAYTFKTK